ncbi:MAG TPA: molybdopterin-guanine dinucleotide biosynthesis protein B [Longimicrobium sp.]|jgi:molybdopterin-guanine dinucleotide biosynthesis protein MobB|uniref:molybdopterin-guanine dinucleotide biosynthesis protein B n=1 Tax=Longimicrobium sp. TaxID=2029185 RepID=UPI002ED82B32
MTDSGAPPSPTPLGAILAGGASRRFGAPKALAPVGGRRIVDRVQDALTQVADPVVIIANDAALFADLDLPIRPDDVPGLGALGGIRTALRWALEMGRTGALVVACDMPFVSADLLRAVVDRAASTDVDAVVPESGGRRGIEPLCAWYSVRCLPEVDRMLADGERQSFRLADRIRAARIPIHQVRRIGDPGVLFLNVNTVDDLRAAERITSPEMPPVVCIVGKKNSGKTTLATALLAELKRRGFRVASIKHGHHAFETDQPGRDSWRHFNEGEAQATIMAGEGKIALVMRIDGEPDPRQLVRDFYTGRGYDLVLIEGYKQGPFPRIEVFRRAVHDRPIHDLATPDPLLTAIVTDDPDLICPVPVVLLDPGDPHAHVARVADLVIDRFLAGANAR